MRAHGREQVGHVDVQRPGAAGGSQSSRLRPCRGSSCLARLGSSRRTPQSCSLPALRGPSDRVQVMRSSMTAQSSAHGSRCSTRMPPASSSAILSAWRSRSADSACVGGRVTTIVSAGRGLPTNVETSRRDKIRLQIRTRRASRAGVAAEHAPPASRHQAPPRCTPPSGVNLNRMRGGHGRRTPGSVQARSFGPRESTTPRGSRLNLTLG